MVQAECTGSLGYSVLGCCAPGVLAILESVTVVSSEVKHNQPLSFDIIQERDVSRHHDLDRDALHEQLFRPRGY